LTSADAAKLIESLKRGELPAMLIADGGAVLMLGSLFKFVFMVGISAVVAVIVVAAFDDYYQDLEERRMAKWQARQSRKNHPSSSGAAL
jgi:hypothetical protein